MTEISNPRCPMCNNRVPADIIGVEISGLYDGVLYWVCGRCGWGFHRFPYNQHFRRLRRLADPYVEREHIDAWLLAVDIERLPDPETHEDPAEAGPS